ncbi:MAG: preprotein translocase subunit SecY [Sphingomonadales bacterium]|nr:preprotein translocase subunit SecY [Sphingomonadales bacterium]
MASAAEQMASNISLGNFAKATELKKRLWFTIGALVLFRLLSFVPIPGIDPRAMAALYQTQSGGVLDFFNTFSGGALERMSIVALGVMPYITASIVVQLGATLYPSWQQLRKEGETGRKKLNQYTRYLTVLLTMVQGYLIAAGLEGLGAKQGIAAVVEPGMLFRVAATISLIGGTLFLMWIGEQITSRGIGNGVSLIIMAGIVARLPQAIGQLLEGARTGSIDGLLVFGIVVLAAALILFICFMERAQRRVLIQYPKRQTARGAMQQERSHLLTLYALGIAFFCFFYTAVQFNSEETADNLKRHGGFIPGIRPGKATEHYFDYLLNRITVIGAAYLVLICLVPEILSAQAGLNFRLGGTSLLIVVNVTMDTVSQIQSHLIAHQYGDLIKKAKLKGARRR